MKRKLQMASALIVAIAIFATGTYAWQQSYEERNEFTGSRNEISVTVHDDFDPETGLKDVYVENRGSATLYVRIRLDEAMNLTSNSWRPQAADWVTHRHGTAAADCGHANISDEALFHDYFKWTLGGWKYFMPSAGRLGIARDTTSYNGTEPGVKATPNAAIATSTQFIAMSEPVQKAFTGWIFSADGYAYWSQPLHAYEVTGLLLNGVRPMPNLDALDYYYAINVIAEVVDLQDIPMWTQGAPSTDGSGATNQEATPDGKEVINIIVGKPDSATPSITLSNIPVSVKVGGTANPPTVTVGPAGSPNSPLVWRSEDVNIATVGADGKITGIAEGPVRIYVTAPNGLTASFVITVTSGTVHASDVEVLGGDQVIYVGQTYEPAILVTPVNCTETPVWSSLNPLIASADPETGMVTGISVGEAVIIVNVGSASGFFNITVIDPSSAFDLPVNDPEGGYTPDMSFDDGNGYLAKFDFGNPDEPGHNKVFHNGSIRLSDVIRDGNYEGVTAIAVDDKYKPFISVGYNHMGDLSIIYSYMPTLQEIIDIYVGLGDEDITIPIRVTLNRDDGKSATITINMIYRGCLFVWYDMD